MTEKNPQPGEYWRVSTGEILEVRAVEKVSIGELFRTDGCSHTRGFFIERVKVVPDPHPEPRVFWINVHDNAHFAGVFATRGEADERADTVPGRIACVRVTEGQFDE